MSSSNLVRIGYAKEATYGVTPPAVKALLAVQDITYTAVKAGAPGNSITIQYADTATAGAETVVVSGNAILVGIEDGVSTATQVRAAVLASSAAVALVTPVISGTAGDAQVTAAATALATGAGEFSTARFISESFSGSPETTESQQIRTDRMSSGQVVTGLTVESTLSFELAREDAIDDFIESAMYNVWDVKTIQTRSLTISVSGKTITAVTGSFISDGLVVGDFITLSGFTAPTNNVQVMVTSVSALVIGFAGPVGMVDGTGGSTAYKRADKISIGTTKKSLCFEKAFLDLTNKAINYRGMIASSMELSVEYGSLITGSFGFSGNDYVTADAASEFQTFERYIKAPATTNSLNGSVDMPLLATDVTGVYDTNAFCIQSLSVSLSNNLSSQTCIGKIAPEDYTPGTAGIEVSLSSYLKDANWDLLARKLSQESFALGFQVKNGGGWYAFYMPAIQVSFDDPSSGGANQDVVLDMSGTGRVGNNGESALIIYRS